MEIDDYILVRCPRCGNLFYILDIVGEGVSDEDAICPDCEEKEGGS